MKKIIKYLTILPVLGLLFVSCENFLDVAPDERLEINTPEKIEATLIGSYQNTRGYRFTHFSTDDVTLANKVYSNNEIIEDLYAWNREFRNQKHQDSPSSYWVAAYGSISQVNHALRALDEIELEDKDKAKTAAIKGEALVMRSYSHFMLVNIFSKHYNVTSAASDLGVPYVFKPETKLKVDYERESVEKTYQLAEKDLLDGIKLMVDNADYINSNKYRFTLATAYNYASRFYTFRNKDQDDILKAKEFGEKAINAYGGLEVMRHWSEYEGNEYAPVNVDHASVGMVQLSYSWIQYDWIYQMTENIKNDYLVKNPFVNSDSRLAIVWKKGGDIFIPSYYYTLDRDRGGVSGYDIFPVYEAVLNSAEAAIRTGDYIQAKSLMEVIGSNSYIDYNPDNLTTEKLKTFYNVTDDKEAWTSYLLYERRMMFLLQGMRWFDIKRYDIDVVHVLDDLSEIKLSEIAPDKDIQIRLAAISSGMKPNPNK